jgi:hypothetical protein
MQPTITHMDGSFTDRTGHLPKPSIYEARPSTKRCDSANVLPYRAAPSRTDPHQPG